MLKEWGGKNGTELALMFLSTEEGAGAVGGKGEGERLAAVAGVGVLPLE